MPFVQSHGAVEDLTGARQTWVSGTNSVNLYGRRQTYAQIYSTQPNVRTCVDFIARNVAQLGIGAYRRVSDTDRERLPKHQLLEWLRHPAPGTTRYRLIENLMGDLGIYFDAYWMKVRTTAADGRPRLGLVRLPPEEMDIHGGLLPDLFRWTHNGRSRDFPVSEIVHFDGFNPATALKGLSPLETLRRILAEEAAAGDHREGLWRNASRMDGVIERPATAPKWTGEQKNTFRDQWQARYAGGAGAGRIALLEDGMTFKSASFSARESEYISGRKLTREECAAAFHIPQPMVGILEHATFSNIKEQHKHLYQDCLGPWLEMLRQELMAQVLPECDDTEDVYIEFNIAQKLQGSFEEQALSINLTVGRPIMTANEGRALLNLPAITDDPTADQLAPQQGGPAIPGGFPRQDSATTIEPIVRAHWSRQRASLKLAPAPAAAFAAQADRWTRELTTDLLGALLVENPTAMSPAWAATYLAATTTAETLHLLTAGADAFADTRKVRDA